MLKKMYPIEEAPFLREVVDVISNMYRLGWDERNGGNLSYRLDPELTSQYLDLTAVKRRIDIGFDASALRGELFLSLIHIWYLKPFGLPRFLHTSALH